MTTSAQHPRTFKCAGRTFELRTNFDGNQVAVDCFENGRTTGVRGRVDLDVHSDFSRYGLGNASGALADAIERYVRDILEPKS
jgi:hypothetical protein